MIVPVAVMLIVSFVVPAFTLIMAFRSDPAPLSAVDVTVYVAAKQRRGQMVVNSRKRFMKIF